MDSGRLRGNSHHAGKVTCLESFVALLIFVDNVVDAGFAGTTPFGKLTPEFIDRLCGVDPTLTDLNYGAETYDAVMITALATLVAGIQSAAEAERDGALCDAVVGGGKAAGVVAGMGIPEL